MEDFECSPKEFDAQPAKLKTLINDLSQNFSLNKVLISVQIALLVFTAQVIHRKSNVTRASIVKPDLFQAKSSILEKFIVLNSYGK